MDSTTWDERYAGRDLVWSQGPNVWVEEVASPLPPGTVLDLAAGEGRNALWLTGRGWTATAADFSAVGLERASRLARERLGEAAERFSTLRADATTWTPDRTYDLVLVVYLQLPASGRSPALATAADAVGPGGRLVVVAHHPDNLTDGVGGPQDPDVLYDAAAVLADVAGRGLQAERADRVVRPVEGSDRAAVDTLVVLRRS